MFSTHIDPKMPRFVDRVHEEHLSPALHADKPRPAVVRVHGDHRVYRYLQGVRSRGSDNHESGPISCAETIMNVDLYNVQ